MHSHAPRRRTAGELAQQSEAVGWDTSSVSRGSWERGTVRLGRRGQAAVEGGVQHWSGEADDVKGAAKRGSRRRGRWGFGGEMGGLVFESGEASSSGLVLLHAWPSLTG